jgi:Ser/Thr protein kinase RdoA (MazF antagonist)
MREKIMEVNFNNILVSFGIDALGAQGIEQIYKSAWKIGDDYILKRSSNLYDLEKSIAITRLLTEREIPVAQFIKTMDGKPYVALDGEYYCLMQKISGEHMDPYVGDSKTNGKMLGNIVAKLHLALKTIENRIECYDADYMNELGGWILDEIADKEIVVRQKIIDDSVSFEELYRGLPRQLIHRDMHLGNLLFDHGKFVGYLDFDISQKNVRIFDLCYLGASMLVDNYWKEDRFKAWCSIFDSVLEEYGNVSPLSPSELEAIPQMFVLIELTFVAFFSKVGQPELSNRCIEMTNWLYDNKERIEFRQ